MKSYLPYLFGIGCSVVFGFTSWYPSSFSDLAPRKICSCGDSVLVVTTGRECVIEAIIDSSLELKRDSFSVARIDSIIEDLNNLKLDSLTIKGFGYYSERNRRRGMTKAENFADYIRSKLKVKMNIIVRGYDTLSDQNIDQRYLLKSIVLQRSGGHPMK